VCATHCALETPAAVPSGGIEEISAPDRQRGAEGPLSRRGEAVAEILCDMLLQAACEHACEHRFGAG
jgi:hypothetical protein